MTELELGDWKDIIHRCFRCGYCKYTYDFSALNCPSFKKHRFETYSTGGRMWTIYGLLKGEVSWDDDIADVLFACSTCGNCMENCRFDKFSHFLVDFIEQGRAEAVKQGYCPTKQREILNRTVNEEYYNPYGEPNSTNEDLKRIYKLPEKAEWVYFIGCTSNYRQKELRDATLRFLKKAKINFTLIDEHCCSSPLIRTGQLTPVKDLMRHNVHQIQKAGATKVITSCAGCYRTLKNDFEKHSVTLDFEVIHTSELIKELLKDQRLTFNSSMNETVTYHDPCHLGRHSGKYEDPREVISQIPQINFKEMRRNRENAWCCGAGGGVKIGYPDWALEISEDRILEAKETGATVLLSTCPFCRTNLTDANEHYDGGLKVLDLIEMIDRLDYEIVEKPSLNF